MSKKKTISIILLWAIILIIVLSYVTYLDALSLQKTFTKEKVIFVLDNNGRIETSLIIDFSKTNEEEAFIFLTQEEQSEIDYMVREKNYGSLIINDGKIFIFKISVIENLLRDDLYLEDLMINKEQTLEILTSEKPLETYKTMTHRIPTGLNDQEFKAKLFYRTLQEIMPDPEDMDKSISFFEEYKKENIVVYPKTMFFRFLKIFPISTLTRVT